MVVVPVGLPASHQYIRCRPAEVDGLTVAPHDECIALLAGSLHGAVPGRPGIAGLRRRRVIEHGTNEG